MIFIGAASLCWILCLVSASGVPENITLSPGEEALLQCKAVKKGDVMVVKWTKSDLKDKYVFLQVDSHVESENQHPSFTNRVELQDRQMKDGDASLILKNVTTDDDGTYECLVKTHKNRRKRANLEPISIITLRVVAPPPGPAGGATEDEEEQDGVRGRPGLTAGICVAAMFLLVAVMSAIVTKTQEKKKSPVPAPPDKDTELQLI